MPNRRRLDSHAAIVPWRVAWWGSTLLTRNTSSRRPSIARPISRSLAPSPYISAVSMSVIPRSRPVCSASISTASGCRPCPRCHVPMPRAGIVSPEGNGTVGIIMTDTRGVVGHAPPSTSLFSTSSASTRNSKSHRPRLGRQPGIVCDTTIALASRAKRHSLALRTCLVRAQPQSVAERRVSWFNARRMLAAARPDTAPSGCARTARPPRAGRSRRSSRPRPRRRGRDR